MRVGTKSILFGVHNFLLHPPLVGIAWWRLYGFPLDPRLWLAFLLHDVGYVGKRSMEGPEGETHVELGARIIGRFFGPNWADFYKLCGIRENFKSFLGRRGMGVRVKGPLPRSAM